VTRRPWPELRLVALAGLADYLICGTLVSWKRDIPELGVPKESMGLRGPLDSVFTALCPRCVRPGLEPIEASIFPVFVEAETS